MKGYNGTIFAYGQTGTGKTYTMMVIRSELPILIDQGDLENDSYKGLIPRIIENIFTTIMKSPASIEFMVKVSYMEIYMEKIRDLLNRISSC